MSTTTVYRLIKDGALTGTRIGQSLRFTRKNVEGLLDAVPSIGFNNSATSAPNSRRFGANHQNEMSPQYTGTCPDDSASRPVCRS